MLTRLFKSNNIAEPARGIPRAGSAVFIVRPGRYLTADCPFATGRISCLIPLRLGDRPPAQVVIPGIYPAPHIILDTTRQSCRLTCDPSHHLPARHSAPLFERAVVRERIR